MFSDSFQIPVTGLWGEDTAEDRLVKAHAERGLQGERSLCRSQAAAALYRRLKHTGLFPGKGREG